jgi:hypothetical protein
MKGTDIDFINDLVIVLLFKFKILKQKFLSVENGVY